MNDDETCKPRFDGVYISDIQESKKRGLFNKRTDHLRLYTQFFEDGTYTTLAMVSENPNRPRFIGKLEKTEPRTWSMRDGEIEIPHQKGGFVYYTIDSDGNLKGAESGDVETFVPHS